MNETGLNIEYICKKTLLNKDNKLVPIILDLMQECYRAGLCQAEYDNTMNLIEENQELKQKYENAVADYEKTRFEKEQLKKQLEEHKNIYIKKVNNFLAENVEPDPEDLYMAELEQRAMDCELMEMQQKEFIKYLEDLIEHKRLNATCMFEYNVTVLPLKEILQKHKEIIGDAR